jgi:hypothetical protein
LLSLPHQPTDQPTNQTLSSLEPLAHNLSSWPWNIAETELETVAAAAAVVTHLSFIHVAKGGDMFKSARPSVLWVNEHQLKGEYNIAGEEARKDMVCEMQFTVFYGSCEIPLSTGAFD